MARKPISPKAITRGRHWAQEALAHLEKASTDRTAALITATVVPHQDLRNPALGDQRFDKRIGKHVECAGFIVGDALLVDIVTLIKD